MAQTLVCAALGRAAVADRLTWMQAHPEAAGYRFGRESEPCWTEVGWATYARGCLRAMSEETLRWLLGMEVERLVRSVEEAPGLVGGAEWTRGVLGACEHVAQVYGEWKRRHKARRARAMVREELAAFVGWDAPAEECQPEGFCSAACSSASTKFLAMGVPQPVTRS
jgi:hypothetical protein